MVGLLLYDFPQNGMRVAEVCLIPFITNFGDANRPPSNRVVNQAADEPINIGMESQPDR